MSTDTAHRLELARSTLRDLIDALTERVYQAPQWLQPYLLAERRGYAVQLRELTTSDVFMIDLLIEYSDWLLDYTRN